MKEMSTANIMPRRSSRLQAKESVCKNMKYLNHIKMLHEITGDLHIMLDNLEVDKLRRVIDDYENIMGCLLGV
jgi:hypothetical protein